MRRKRRGGAEGAISWEACQEGLDSTPAMVPRIDPAQASRHKKSQISPGRPVS